MAFPGWLGAGEGLRESMTMNNEVNEWMESWMS